MFGELWMTLGIVLLAVAIVVLVLFAHHLVTDRRSRGPEVNDVDERPPAEPQRVHTPAYMAGTRFSDLRLIDKEVAPAAVPPQAAPRAPATPTIAYAPPVVDRWLRRHEIRPAYNRLAAQALPSVQRAFMAEWRVETVVPTTAGFVPAEVGPLWWIAAADSRGEGFLAPSWPVIRDWAKFYRDLGGATAREAFGAIYDISAGPTLEITELARGERVGGTIRLVERGALVGVL